MKSHRFKINLFKIQKIVEHLKLMQQSLQFFKFKYGYLLENFNKVKINSKNNSDFCAI